MNGFATFAKKKSVESNCQLRTKEYVAKVTRKKMMRGQFPKSARQHFS